MLSPYPYRSGYWHEDHLTRAFGIYDDCFYAAVPAQNNDRTPDKGPWTVLPWDSFAYQSEYQQSLPQLNSSNNDTICQVENIENNGSSGIKHWKTRNFQSKTLTLKNKNLNFQNFLSPFSISSYKNPASKIETFFDSNLHTRLIIEGKFLGPD